MTTGKHAERTNLDFRCPNWRSVFILVQGALGKLGRKKKMTVWGHAGPLPRIGYYRSAIGQASCLICECSRQLALPFCCKSAYC